MLAILLLCVAAAGQARDVRVGVYANEPKVYLDAQGRPAGILIELLQEIAARERWTLRFEPCEWDACLTALAAGHLDLMPDVAYMPERERLLDFHKTPALFSWSQVYRRRDAPVQSILDLNNRRVAVLRGSIQARMFVELAHSFGVRAELVEVASLDQAFALVAEGGVDAAIANTFFGSVQAPRYGLIETAIVFQPARLFYATTKDENEDLLEAIDLHLDNWLQRSDSPYFQVMKRWAAAQSHPVVPRAFWWGLAAVASLLLFSLLGVMLLRRQVAARTRHLMTANEEISRFKVIFDHTGFAAWIADLEGRIIYANARCAETHKILPDALLGRSFMELYDHAHRTEAEAYWQAVRDGEDLPARELEHVAPDGQVIPMLCSGLLLRDKAGRPVGLAGTAVDISERKLAEAHIHQLAFFDALTGLPNRRLLMDHLRHALALSSRRKVCGALLFIDLDHFKTINDTLGHDVGDLLLKEVAHRIQSLLRSGDTVARLGGDEFVVLVEELSPAPALAMAQADSVAQKIMSTLSAPYPLAGSEQHSTCSIGVTLYGGRGETVEELLKQADLAMYQAKNAGRNSVCFFDPQMQAAVAARAALQSDLRKAIEGGQLFLHIQPQVTGDMGVVGGEALLRWQHPQRGLVPPGEFIPVAEDMGQIHALGEWVLEAVCQQLVQWRSHPVLKEISLSVNVSVQQFRHPDFVARTFAIMDRTGVDPRRLKFEITESLLMTDVDGVIEKMGALRARGVGFSIDDFGTGYSSLAYLRRLPLEQLKIDASFVRDLDRDDHAASIVNAIIALANSLRLGLVAEGVETESQSEALAAKGCGVFQGFLYSRPLPVSQFADFVLRGKTQPHTLR